MALFPPSLPSAEKVFSILEEPSFEFQLSQVTGQSDFLHVEVLITKQSNNSSVIPSTDKSPDNIRYLAKNDPALESLGNNKWKISVKNDWFVIETIYSNQVSSVKKNDGTTKNITSVKNGTTAVTSFSYDTNIRFYYDNGYVSIANVSEIILKDNKIISVDQSSQKFFQLPWQAGILYKIQVRLGVNGLWPLFSGQSFADWKKDQINTIGALSEWSNVLVIKAIDTSGISLSVVVNGQLATGYYTSLVENKEAEKLYRFTLKKNGEELENSGWLYHDPNTESDQYKFKYQIMNGLHYQIKYEVETENGYSLYKEEPYSLPENPIIFPEAIVYCNSDSQYCLENGCIEVILKTPKLYSGIYTVLRSSEADNYVSFDELFSFYQPIDEQEGQEKYKDGATVYTDFTIESGVRYKYAMQKEDTSGNQSRPIITADYYVNNLEYSYIYRDGVQLALKFDNDVSSFKHTVLRAKQDTLGDKYPHLVANGNAYYAEFPIKGLITINTDEDSTFFKQEVDGWYYRDELVVAGRSIREDTKSKRDYYAPKPENPESLKPPFTHKTGYEPGDTYPRPDDLIASANSEPAAGEVGSSQGSSEPSGTAAAASNLFSSSLDYHKTDLSYDNIFMERKFREKVEEFLNDFTYKLYRSPTEGNIVIGLMNVTLSPRKQLGRMLFDFSATAYEVMDNSVDSLKNAGIIKVITDIEDTEFFTLDNQLCSYVITPSSEEKNIINKIENECPQLTGYNINTTTIKRLWIDSGIGYGGSLYNVWMDTTPPSYNISGTITEERALGTYFELPDNIANEQDITELSVSFGQGAPPDSALHINCIYEVKYKKANGGSNNSAATIWYSKILLWQNDGSNVAGEWLTSLLKGNNEDIKINSILSISISGYAQLNVKNLKDESVVEVIEPNGYKLEPATFIKDIQFINNLAPGGQINCLYEIYYEESGGNG